MSTIEAVLNFFATYPSWAKAVMVVGLLAVLATALLAPRSTPIDVLAQPKPPVAKPEINTTTYLKITGVTAFSVSPTPMIRVVAFVNETPFTYPSLAGVDWLSVGPAMSSQTFQLPKAQKYEIRFEMETKGTPGRPGVKYVSQETVLINRFPFSGEYSVYPTKKEGVGVSRAASVGAEIKFSVETPQ